MGYFHLSNPVRAALFPFVENHQGPIIMSGDFNAWNERRLNLVNNLIQNMA